MYINTITKCVLKDCRYKSEILYLMFLLVVIKSILDNCM